MSYRLDVEPEDWYPEYNDYWTEERFEATKMAENESDSERVYWEEEDIYEGVFEWFDSNEYFIFQFEEHLPE
jgi:hypothetical protein